MCMHINDFIFVVEFLKIIASEMVHEVKVPVSKSDGLRGGGGAHL